MTRIIAGQARGRTITVPEEGTRPTSDRAREGLFSSLAVRWVLKAPTYSISSPAPAHWASKPPAGVLRKST